MTLLTVAGEADAKDLRAFLEAQGVATTVTDLADVHAGHLEHCSQAVLVMPGRGALAIGETVIQLRERLGARIPLLLCCPQIGTADRRRLTDCGATSIVAPASWATGDIACRILGELVASGVTEPTSLGTLQGGTAVMRRLYAEIETLAPLSDPVLILGETGTGKEVVAQEIHRLSGRQGKWSPINCAALTPELLESELFGHEKGAFTGAVTTRKGLLADAGNGTILLDEIGELPPPAQAKLLRVLETRRVRPVGSNQEQPIQARLLLATHRDLEQGSQDGSFRPDLYQRVQGFSIAIPPLRERRGDLVLLAHHFVAEYNRDNGGRLGIPDGALDSLFRYHWPGNLRELRSTLRRAAAYGDRGSGMISSLTLVDKIQQRAGMRTAGRKPWFDADKENWNTVFSRLRAEYFRAVLTATRGNKARAAERAGLSRSQFYEVLKQIEAGSPPGSDAATED